MKKKLLGWMISRAIYLIYRFLCLTIRWEYIGERYTAESPPFVLGYWHARILMLPYAFPGWTGSLLISEHRDGNFIADAASLMGFESTRGSSTRGGARAMLALIRVGRSGHPVAVTPDGPKGPVEEVKMGVVQIAKKTGLPFRSACYASKRYWRIESSWDSFYIPKPFTRGVFVYGELLSIAPDEPDDIALARVQQTMDETQQKADSYFSK